MFARLASFVGRDATRGGSVQVQLGGGRAALAAVVPAAGLLTVAAVALANQPSGTVVAAFKVTLTVAAVAAALVMARTAVLASGRTRAAWLSLAFGLGAFALGVGARAWRALDGYEIPFPSAIDLTRLLLPVGACVALLLLQPAGTGALSRLRLLLDGLVVAGSFVIVAWTGVLDDIQRVHGADQFAVAASMAYPMPDAVVCTVALLVYLAALPGQRLTVGLIGLASLCIAITNEIAVYFIAAQNYSEHRAVAVGWLAGLLLFIAVGVAGRHWADRGTAVAQSPSQLSMLVPFVPVASAAAVVTFIELPNDVLRGPLSIAGVLLVLAFLARQLLVVGENRRLFNTVARQALRDPLTGLANRAVFYDRVGHAMQMRQRGGLSVGVMELDLDGFKLFNDTLGHHVGDALLTLVGERVLGSVRPGDTAARLGGDEFAVLIEGRVDNTTIVAHRVAEAFDRPFVLEDREIMVRPSIGLAVAAADDVEVDAEELLKRAGIALDAAKRSRVAGVHAFTAEMAAETFADRSPTRHPTVTAGGERSAGIQLLGELRQAVDHGDLVLLYQPKVDLQTLDVVAVEALVRWPHPRRGLLGPEEFLPLVRQHGLMGPVTDLVVNKALDDALVWQVAGFDVPVAVNISAPSLATMRLAGTIAAALAARGVAASSVIVEITEDLFLDSMDRTRLLLDELRRNGIRIAIDDFGSGYSALSYLLELPVDQVKLDRKFVAPITTDPRAAVVVRAVVGLAHELGLITVAEGIEDAGTLERLREYGCDVGQGYYFSPPTELDGLIPMLANPPWAPGAARLN